MEFLFVAVCLYILRGPILAIIVGAGYVVGFIPRGLYWLWTAYLQERMIERARRGKGLRGDWK